MSSKIPWTEDLDRQKIIQAIDGCNALVDIAEQEETKDYLRAVKEVLEYTPKEYPQEKPCVTAKNQA